MKLGCRAGGVARSVRFALCSRAGTVGQHREGRRQARGGRFGPAARYFLQGDQMKTYFAAGISPTEQFRDDHREIPGPRALARTNQWFSDTDGGTTKQNENNKFTLVGVHSMGESMRAPPPP